MIDARNVKRLLIPVAFSSLLGCSNPESAPVQTRNPTFTKQLSPEIGRLYNDIAQAQAIEQHKPGSPERNEPIAYEFGTDSAHKAYHFANLRALRLNIKQRIDSLRNAGSSITYDTILGPATHGILSESSLPTKKSATGVTN